MKLIAKILSAVVLWCCAQEVCAQGLHVRLVNIRYYLDGGCGEELPVKVKVCFETNRPKPDNLRFVAYYSDIAKSETRVKESDSAMIYYTFCTKEGVTSTLDIVVEDQDGNRSRRFTINTLATPQNIIKP